MFGWVYGGAIENLTIYGNIDCPDSYNCGGFVGDLGSVGDQYVRNCSFIGNVSGKTNVGGIAGCSWLSCNVENCYFNGSITSSDNAGISGGIIGDISNGYEDIAGKSMMQSLDEILGTPYVHNDNIVINDGYPVFEWQYVKPVSGDVNGDGKLDTVDVVHLQKWILQAGTSKLKNSTAADFNGDGAVDVFDLGLMKRALVNGNNTSNDDIDNGGDVIYDDDGRYVI